MAFDATYFTRFRDTDGHLRYSYWTRWIEKRFGRSARVLELGSGLGPFVTVWKGDNLIASDVAMHACGVLASHRRAKTLCASATDIPLASESVSVVVAFDVLEHLATPSDAVAEIRRVLRPGGVLIAAMPNPTGLGARVKRGSRGHPAWHGARDSTHVSLLSISEWQRLFVENGFEVTRAGTDFLWDVPYPLPLPKGLQKGLLFPWHLAVSRLTGLLPWSIGENIVVVLTKPA